MLESLIPIESAHISGNISASHTVSLLFFSLLFFWIFLSLLLSFSLSVCNLRSSAHCVCHPLSTACGFTERERGREICVLFWRSVCFSSLIRGHWEGCRDQTPAALAHTVVWTWNKHLYTPTLVFAHSSGAHPAPCLFTSRNHCCTLGPWFISVLMVNALTSSPDPHLFFPSRPFPPITMGCSILIALGITIVSAFYHFYGQFDGSQLSYQALQQSPIREDPLSPRQW